MDISKDPYQKLCKYEFCKKEFIARRLNHDYCCPDHKTKANNMKAKVKRDATKKINYILQNNRAILEDLYNKDQINVTLNKLQEMGFEYDFHTHRKKETRLKLMVPFYFEFGLINDKEESLNLFIIWKL